MHVIKDITVDEFYSETNFKASRPEAIEDTSKQVETASSREEIPYVVDNPLKHVFAASQQHHHLHQSGRKQHYDFEKPTIYRIAGLHRTVLIIFNS